MSNPGHEFDGFGFPLDGRNNMQVDAALDLGDPLNLLGNPTNMHPNVQGPRPTDPGSQSLFNAYAAQFGVTKPSNNTQGSNPAPSSVEEYAALMGVKLEQPSSSVYNAAAQQNANNIEAMMKSSNQPGNLTSMTLPAGIGSGVQNPMQFNAPPVQRTPVHPPTKNIPSRTPTSGFQFPKPQGVMANMGGIGSQTLAPEVLQSMIQSNLQNNGAMGSWNVGSSSWTAPDVDMKAADQEAMSKADKSRERNRDHSRKSRLRKKVFVENLKQEVKQLGIYKEICEQCMDLVAVVTSEPSATFTFASSAYSRRLGIDANELATFGKSLYDYIHPDDVQQAKDGLKRVGAFGELAGIKYRIKSIDGEYFPADTSARMTEKGVILITRVDKETVRAEKKN